MSKKVVSILIVACSILIILASVGLNYVPGSLTSVAFSIMNAIHGPVLFIYLCARFNDYSLKRHKYAIHRSTISKLRNFQFVARDVIASCVLSILVVETLFIGRLVTSTQSSGSAVKQFYQSDRLPIRRLLYNTTEFCPYNFNETSSQASMKWATQLNETTTMTTTMMTMIPLNEISLTSQPSSYTTETVTDFFYYLFAISFNWYPFIGFFVCCLSLATFNLTRLFLRMLLNVFLALKCLRKCC